MAPDVVPISRDRRRADAEVTAREGPHPPLRD
jgi:hypothetical protein